ncbi:hypothetical protein HHI36_012932 [Cryptolaemus montrouzieri]|uniref:Uncharacterized protein n=1 Tax=Cryptolaemus montrouzieri TaxID=559131 RepID=A0ABD2NFW1_9CUCU
MKWCLDCSRKTAFLIILPIFFDFCSTASSFRDIFNLDTNKLVRVPREEKIYLDRYGGNVASESVLNTRTIKPEDAQDTRDPAGTNVGKRCIRCEPGRYSPYDPYDRRYDGYRDRYDDRYDDQRDRYYDRRYDDRRYDDRRYDDRRYDDRRYEPYDRYDRYDKYERYDQRREYYDRDRDYNGRDRDRAYDRGIGYDNRGYDYRDYWGGYRERDRERDYRPSYYEDRGDDLAGRGYGGRPNDYGYWGRGYASSWNYGGGRDDYRDRYGDDRYRYRDPYDGYRPTSYLYGRPTSPISNTTMNPADTTMSSGNTNSG